MGDIEREIVVDGSIERVREEVMEPKNAIAWQRNLKEFEFTTPGPPAVGSECRGVLVVAGHQIDWTAKVTDWGEGGYTIRAQGLGPSFEVAWTFEAVDAGTLVRYRQSSPAFDGMTGAFIKGKVQSGVTRDLAALRERIEGA